MEWPEGWEYVGQNCYINWELWRMKVEEVVQFRLDVERWEGEGGK
jgi:hypothetical protein